MSYPKASKILQPTHGVNRDTPGHAVSDEFYNHCQNVVFRRGFPNRVKGSRDIYETALATIAPGQIMHLVNANLNDVNYWVLCEADGSVWSIQGATADDIDGTNLFQSQPDPSLYSSVLLNGIPVINNSVDEPVYWPGSGEITTLPDWTATETCKFMTAFRFHLFAMDISGPGGTFRNLIRWSDAAAPGTVPASWTPGPSTNAGNVELADGKGPILCGVQLRDAMVIYKQSMAYICQFVGGNNIFAFQPLKRSFGTLNRKSVVDIGERHFIVEQGDIVLSDGVNRQSIGESRIKDFLFNQLDQTNFENLFCIFDAPNSEVLIALPGVGSSLPNVGITYNINTDSFGIRDLPDIECAASGYVTDVGEDLIWDNDSDPWDSDSTFWDSTKLTASAESLIFSKLDAIELQNTTDAVDVAAFVAKYDMDFDDAKRVKFIKRLHIEAEAGFGSFFVRAGSRMTVTDTIVWQAEKTLTEPDSIVDVEAQGRFISFEIRSTGSNQWVINHVEIEGEMRGYH